MLLNLVKHVHPSARWNARIVPQAHSSYRRVAVFPQAPQAIQMINLRSFFCGSSYFFFWVKCNLFQFSVLAHGPYLAKPQRYRVDGGQPSLYCCGCSSGHQGIKEKPSKHTAAWHTASRFLYLSTAPQVLEHMEPSSRLVSYPSFWYLKKDKHCVGFEIRQEDGIFSPFCCCKVFSMKQNFSCAQSTSPMPNALSKNRNWFLSHLCACSTDQI